MEYDIKSSWKNDRTDLLICADEVGFSPEENNDKFIFFINISAGSTSVILDV